MVGRAATSPPVFRVTVDLLVIPSVDIKFASCNDPVALALKVSKTVLVDVSQGFLHCSVRSRLVLDQARNFCLVGDLMASTSCQD